MRTDALISPAELASRLAVPLATVYHWNKDGTGPAYFRIGRHVRYRVEDVEAWLDERQAAVRHA